MTRLAECCDHIGKCSGFSCSVVTSLKENLPDTCAGTQCTNAEWCEPTVKCTMAASSDTEVLNVDVASKYALQEHVPLNSVASPRLCSGKQIAPMRMGLYWYNQNVRNTAM